MHKTVMATIRKEFCRDDGMTALAVLFIPWRFICQCILALCIYEDLAPQISKIFRLKNRFPDLLNASPSALGPTILEISRAAGIRADLQDLFCPHKRLEPFPGFWVLCRHDRYRLATIHDCLASIITIFA